MKKIIISSVMVFTLFLVACNQKPAAAPAGSAEPTAAAEPVSDNVHPMEMEKKECITCHSDPDTVDNTSVVAEYNMSIHSFAGVMCGNCHGDEADFRRVPSKASCEPCHSEQVANVNSKLPCESCHIAHTYNVHMPMQSPQDKK